jgi:hypothetical protein
MTTRSMVVFLMNGKPIINLYRHWDGYPAIAGADLAWQG